MTNYKIGDKIQCVLSINQTSPSGGNRKSFRTHTGLVTKVTQTQVSVDCGDKGAFKFNIKTGKLVGSPKKLVPCIFKTNPILL